LAVLMLVAACGSSTISPSTAGPEWPTFRGDSQRDGHPIGATLTAAQATTLKLLWSKTPGGEVDGSPVVVGREVIAASTAGTVAAYDLRSGAPSWSTGGLGPISGSPAVADGMVVVGSQNGHVYGLRLSDGRSVWDWHAPGEMPAVWSSPAVFGHTVLIGVGSQYGDQPLEAGRVAALDLSSGSQKWIFCIEDGCAPGGGVWSSVAVDGAGRAYVGTGNPNDGVVAFDAATGSRLWAKSFHEDAGRDLDVGATPIVLRVGGREVVAVGSNGGVFDVLDAATGDVIWSRFLVPGSAVHGLIASPAYDGVSLYVASASPPTSMMALDPSTGEFRWQTLTDLPVYAAPAVGSGVVVFGTGDVFGDKTSGKIIALSTTDGSTIWTYDAHAQVFSAPAIVGSMVLTGDSKGEVLAFGPG
jgi:polyvinyl alcohol dehydrogenase (cytochrome)